MIDPSSKYYSLCSFPDVVLEYFFFAGCMIVLYQWISVYYQSSKHIIRRVKYVFIAYAPVSAILLIFSAVLQCNSEVYNVAAGGYLFLAVCVFENTVLATSFVIIGGRLIHRLKQTPLHLSVPDRQLYVLTRRTVALSSTILLLEVFLIICKILYLLNPVLYVSTSIVTTMFCYVLVIQEVTFSKPRKGRPRRAKSVPIHNEVYSPPSSPSLSPSPSSPSPSFPSLSSPSPSSPSLSPSSPSPSSPSLSPSPSLSSSPSSPSLSPASSSALITPRPAVW